MVTTVSASDKQSIPHQSHVYLECDFGGCFLRRGQRLDQLVVIEDVAFRIAQQEQNAVLDILELLLHLRVGNHLKLHESR